MPLRSPKMYSFIFGFQRRVWWPKCSPASSNSFIVISTPKVPPPVEGCFFSATDRSSILFCRSFPAVDLAGPDCSSPAVKKLALAVLEAATRSLLSVLLAFLHARIACQKPVLAQRRPQLRINLRERARKPHAHRSRLTAHTAALHDALHFDLILHLRELQRLNRSRVPGDIAKIFVHRAAIYRKTRRPHLDINARDGLTAAAGAIELLSGVT